MRWSCTCVLLLSKLAECSRHGGRSSLSQAHLLEESARDRDNGRGWRAVLCVKAAFRGSVATHAVMVICHDAVRCRHWYARV
ncbi:hypothetical protein NDU88_006166 [Pleurodeles waltl]|uniref:Secreted protein n=1 Tax=Pleurodeles waltl TaxID=8319 RepID=A0AAV7TDE2_PLEWA|nr:hypothetical protein NDU88_006166 [Pleurodeles waltl]